MRVNRSQEFVIGGYTGGSSTFDAVIIGQVVDGRLVYVARTRSGFTLASRAELMRKMKHFSRLKTIDNSQVKLAARDHWIFVARIGTKRSVPRTSAGSG